MIIREEIIGMTGRERITEMTVMDKGETIETITGPTTEMITEAITEMTAEEETIKEIMMEDQQVTDRQDQQVTDRQDQQVTDQQDRQATGHIITKIKMVTQGITEAEIREISREMTDLMTKTRIKIFRHLSSQNLQ